MTTPLSFFPTRQLCTSIAFPYQIASSATFSTYNDRQRIGHLRVFCAPARAMHLSSVQRRTEKCVVVRERTVTHFKKEWEKILEQCEVPEPFWSVKWIVEHVLRKHPNSEGRCADLSPLQLDAANGMLHKRIQRVPVQYIIGEWDFRNVTLTMQPPVFIPEPETEVLVNLVSSSFHRSSKEQVDDNIAGASSSLTFLDLCCGSGAIAVSLLSDNPDVRGYAVDQSEEAVALTMENACRNHVSDRLNVYCCNVADCVDLLHHQLGLAFDVIVSNPPYVPSADIPHLEREITEYYDHKALDGGPEGLKVIQEVLPSCKHIMEPDG